MGDSLQAALDSLEGPVLVLSTKVGRGMYSLGEALVERIPSDKGVHHRAIEDFLPGTALHEDVKRYRFLSSRMPWLLNLVYRFPPIYMRKLYRERHLRRTDLSALENGWKERGIRTVLCVSHRPAFWAAGWKEERGLDIQLVGLLGEYGSNLGWKYIPWEQMNGFLSPVDRAGVGFVLPEHVVFEEIGLPARRAYEALRERPGDPRRVLIVLGLWGQGQADKILRSILSEAGSARFHVVCGDNEAMKTSLAAEFDSREDVEILGRVDSLVPWMESCGTVITKPGIATLVEAHAAARKLFLVRGMPVAEDNNAHFAIEHFGAEWLSKDGFADWIARA